MSSGTGTLGIIVLRNGIYESSNAAMAGTDAIYASTCSVSSITPLTSAGIFLHLAQHSNTSSTITSDLSGITVVRNTATYMGYKAYSSTSPSGSVVASGSNGRWACFLVSIAAGASFDPTQWNMLSNSPPSGGGITQVLSKQSGADWDYAWVPSPMGSRVFEQSEEPEAPLTGDLWIEP
jgi:hypothetical protein